MLLLLCVSNAITYSRPWENSTWVANNPNIWSYGIQVWWNVPAFHGSLDSIETGPLSRMNLSSSASKSLDRIISTKSNANTHYYQCMIGLSSISFAALSFDFTRITSSAIVSFSQVPYCLRYAIDWKETVDGSLNLAELSIAEAQIQTHSLHRDFTNIKNAGLCAEDYYGPGNYDCNSVNSLIYGTESNLLLGSFDQLRLISNDSNALKIELLKPVPNVAGAISISSIVWGENGYLARIKEAKNSINSSLLIAEEAYLSKKSNVESYESQINSKLSSLKSEKINLIIISTSSSSINSLDVSGTIKERYENYLSEKNNLSKHFSNAIILHTSVRNLNNEPTPYLSTPINLLSSVESNSSLLLSNLNDLENDARQAESDQREEAEAEIELSDSALSSMSSSSLILLANAKSMFNSAPNAATIGQRFDLYRQATALARSARNQRSLDEELNISASLANLEDLIKNAEYDNISVISEKEGLKLIKGLKDFEIINYTEVYTQTIISKARIKYDSEINSTRLRIIEKLRLSGPDAADLYTDLENYEDGIVVDSEILYPDSIGKLSKLLSNYKKLESTLADYESIYVSTAISTAASPNFDSIYLDMPTNISLDIIFVNPTNYSGNNVSGSVSLPHSIDLLYSDIIVGRDFVSSLRMPTDQSLILTFRSFLPFEVKRVIIEKQATIAHTKRSNRTVIGLGQGSVLVTESRDIEVDYDIPHLSFKDDYLDISIDGRNSDISLLRGPHKVIMNSNIENAYSESLDNIKVYKVGLNSHVEYDIRIVPIMDIDTVPIVVYALNTSNVSNLAVYSSSGESLKDKSRVSETEILANLGNLKKNKLAVIKVSYDVRDTESYVTSQISLLSNLNLSPSGRLMLNTAKSEADNGNSTGALAIIEKIKSNEQNFNKIQDNLKSELSSKLEKISNELSSLDIVLTMSNKSSFYPKFTARKTELERLISQSNNSDLNASLIGLSSYDDLWLDSQIDLYKKDLYKNYNSLRERLSKLGNYSTPDEFLLLESELARLEASSRVEYLPSSFAAFENANSFVSLQEKSSESKGLLQKDRFEVAKTKLLGIFSKYSKLASTAKGTEYDHVFDKSEKSISAAIKETQDSLKNPVLFERKMSQLEVISNDISLTIESLKNESQAKHSLLSQLLSESNLPSEKKESLLNKLSLMQSMISSAEYINALRAGTSIAREIDSSSNSSDNSLILLAITGFVILAIIIIFIFKRRGEEKPSALLKKVESFDEEEHQLSVN
jgi:hypothetical protein